jgi:hypothetical protein
LGILEQLSGLETNFHKSEIFYFEKAKEMEEQYKEIIGCGAGSSFLIPRYLNPL